MTHSQLVAHVAERVNLSKGVIDNIFDVMALTVRASIRSGDVKINLLGTFRRRQTKARTGRNPLTGEPIEIPAKTKVKFIPAKALKEAVQDAA